MELEDDTAKQVGSEGKHDVVRSAADIAKQVGLEAEQVGSEDKHAKVGLSNGEAVKWRGTTAI